MVKGAKKATQGILGIQLVVTLVAVLAALLASGAKAAGSAAVGGGISLVVTSYFAWQVFRAAPGASAQRVARALFIGEAVKLVLTAALFAAAFIWLDVSPLPLLLTYALTLLAYWIALPFTLDALVKTR